MIIICILLVALAGTILLAFVALSLAMQLESCEAHAKDSVQQWGDQVAYWQNKVDQLNWQIASHRSIREAQAQTIKELHTQMMDNGKLYEKQTAALSSTIEANYQAGKKLAGYLVELRMQTRHEAVLETLLLMKNGKQLPAVLLDVETYIHRNQGA